MAVMKNNDFSHDTDDVRQARLALLSENVDTYAADLGLVAPNPTLTWAQGAGDLWVDLCVTASRESGDVDEATQEYRLKYEAAREYYVRAKALLSAVLESFQDNDEAAEKYGTMRETPRTVEAVYRKIEQWKDQHDIFVAAGDPRIIADSVVTEMMTMADDFYTGWKFAIEQKREAAQAYDIKQAEFLLGSKYLKLIYQMAVMVWGDEDPRLIELGFQTKSGIWTEGNGGGEQLPTPANFGLEFLDPNLRIFWDAVEGATSYHLEMGNNPTILGTNLYDGTDTEFTFDPPGGHLYFRVWAMKGEEWGERGEAIDIEIEGTPPGPPENLALSYDGTYVHASWEEPATGTPEYFRLYSAVVPLGEIAPPRPAEPTNDEIITLEIGIFAPPPGNTVYIWVTAFHDGVEGEAAGPVGIDVM